MLWQLSPVNNLLRDWRRISIETGSGLAPGAEVLRESPSWAESLENRPQIYGENAPWPLQGGGEPRPDDAPAAPAADTKVGAGTHECI